MCTHEISVSIFTLHISRHLKLIPEAKNFKFILYSKKFRHTDVQVEPPAVTSWFSSSSLPVRKKMHYVNIFCFTIRMLLIHYSASIVLLSCRWFEG